MKHPRTDAGRYSKRPATDVEKMCRDFCDDDVEQITAVESPRAIEAEPRGRRSGTYARGETKAEELQKLRAKCSGGE